MAWNGIDDAQRPKPLSLWRLQQCTGVEPNIGLAGDECVLPRPWIEREVRDDQDVVLAEGVSAD